MLLSEDGTLLDTPPLPKPNKIIDVKMIKIGNMSMSIAAVPVVCADGSVWVADAQGSRVAVFEPDGTHRLDIAVPLPMVTSLCFGGEDLRDLYVVTGSDHGPSETCGTVFRTRVEVPGLPPAPCRVAV